MEEKLLNFKYTTSLIQVNPTELTYGAHIQGVVGKGNKPISSILSIPKDNEEAGTVFNTYIIFNPATKLINELVNNKWLEGTEKTLNLDSYPESIRTNVVKSLNTVKGIFKDNTQTVLTEVTATILKDDMRYKTLVSEITDTYEVLIAEIQKEKLSYSSVGVTDFIDRYAFKKHIMLLGERGAGKTYLASNYLNTQGISTEFIAGHSGIESIDLLGYYIKAHDGSLVWMDGPLTAAFRTAQTEKSAFFIDEILRIPPRELNIFIGALTPDSTGHYQLRTNRIIDMTDDLGKSEILKVPVENLWAIATTNVGAGYDIEDMDLALPDRFRMFEMQNSIDSIKYIVESCIKAPFTNIHVDQLMTLYTAVEALVKVNELTNTINVRYLCEILSICPDPNQLKSYLFDLTSNICSRTTDGNINPVEEKTFKDTIKNIIK